MLDIASGAFDYNTVLMRTVKQLTNSGLRSVDYATGWSNRVDVAARRAVMTGMSQLTAKVNEDNMTALDTEYVEVSWHSGARPSHQEWQGKIYHWPRGKNVDKSGESGIIKTTKNSRNDAVPSAEHYFEKIGDLDISDTKAVAKSLEEFESKYRNSEVEHCRVITAAGEIFEVHGDKWTVDTSLLGDKMRGSINEHNHVTGQSQYSFSWEDLISSADDGSKISMAFDEKYRYSMMFSNKSISQSDLHEAYSNATESVYDDRIQGKHIADDDVQHEIIKRTCEKVGIIYERKSK